MPPFWLTICLSLLSIFSVSGQTKKEHLKTTLFFIDASHAYRSHMGKNQEDQFQNGSTVLFSYVTIQGLEKSAKEDPRSY